MGVKSYVEQRDGGYWVAGTRVSLDSLVYALGGAYGRNYGPVLSRADVGTGLRCRSILSGQPEVIDAYLRQQEADFAHLAQEFRRRIRCCLASASSDRTSDPFDGIPAPGGQSQPPAAASMRQ